VFAHIKLPLSSGHLIKSSLYGNVQRCAPSPNLLISSLQWSHASYKFKIDCSTCSCVSMFVLIQYCLCAIWHLSCDVSWQKNFVVFFD